MSSRDLYFETERSKEVDGDQANFRLLQSEIEKEIRRLKRDIEGV